MGKQLTESERAREHLLDEAVRAGKFSASRKPHYRKLYASKPKATKRLIEELAPGLPETESVPEDSYPQEWLTTRERQTVAAAGASSGGEAPAAPASQPPVASDAYPPGWLTPQDRQERSRITVEA
jgi:hypothetical protein